MSGLSGSPSGGRSGARQSGKGGPRPSLRSGCVSAEIRPNCWAMPGNLAKGPYPARCVREADSITLTVTDTGCGIPAPMREVVFERFTKLDDHKPSVSISAGRSSLASGKAYTSIRGMPTVPGSSSYCRSSARLSISYRRREFFHFKFYTTLRRDPRVDPESRERQFRGVKKRTSSDERQFAA